MAIELKVPALPESVSDATVATWHKKAGDKVRRDENILDLETDKVVLEIPAPRDGVLVETLCNEGDVVQAGHLLGRIEEGAAEASVSKAEATEVTTESKAGNGEDEALAGPAVRRLMAENDIAADQIVGTGKGGRITKQDVLEHLKQPASASLEPTTPAPKSTTTTGREEQRVPMSRLRAKIAERLVASQQEAAMLTTFNEVNLQAVMNIRKQYKDAFEKKHGVKLGFMSFFTKAVVESLKHFPPVNASIDGNDIVYHGYYDVGIAVSTERGLVVPVIRNADQLSMAEIELAIADYAAKAREGKLAMEDMQGGTFTITNGGVFGSLLATPIINPPQTAILGMHKIEERPIAENGEVVIRPMMYLALSYDHRLIDGKESVQFLVSIKSFLEDPSRMLLGL